MENLFRDTRKIVVRGDSSKVKVLGDVPPARVYFIGLLVWARVCFLVTLVKEKPNVGNPCTETQNFDDFDLEKANGIFCLENAKL